MHIIGLFLTLSADDLHWSEIDVLVNSHTYKDSLLQGSMFEAVQKDPFMTAVHFNPRFHALLKYIINRSEKPLGTVVEYFVRDEFRNRDCPHFYMLFWDEGIPTTINNQTVLILQTFPK